MSTTNVAVINGISLQVVADEREQLVAVKPVCEILGVNYTTQVEKLKAHPVFGSVIPLRGTTGADGKTYQMLCIPMRCGRERTEQGAGHDLRGLRRGETATDDTGI